MGYPPHPSQQSLPQRPFRLTFLPEAKEGDSDESAAWGTLHLHPPQPGSARSGRLHWEMSFNLTEQILL